ncbi:MAG: hypothetical protein R3B55_03550 [Candidatus Paceibacterota bacterium]
MELKDFIKTTVKDIVEARVELNEEFKHGIQFSGSSEKQSIEFDIAVSAGGENSSDGELKLPY